MLPVAIHIGSEQFANIFIDLQVLARVLMIAFGMLEQTLEVWVKRNVSVRKPKPHFSFIFQTCKMATADFFVIWNAVPADPLPVIPKCVVGPKCVHHRSKLYQFTNPSIGFWSSCGPTPKWSSNVRLN